MILFALNFFFVQQNEITRQNGKDTLEINFKEKNFTLVICNIQQNKIMKV